MKLLLILSTLAVFISPSYSDGGEPASDPIKDKQNSWTGRALALQRQLDFNEPISTNSILGSHNSYNSQAYRTTLSYIDPQQKHSIFDQLRLGARFIELDAHWTLKLEGLGLKPRLLLCHFGLIINVAGAHVGCSKVDKYVSEGIDEIKDWLKLPENKEEVIILYVEDHTEGRHQELYDIIDRRIGSRIYRSGGCKDIPNDLTKADIVAAGKQVIFYKDEGCSNNQNMANMAFSGFGDISRVWEDATVLGSVLGVFGLGGKPKINSSVLKKAFREGINLVNLDNLTHDDGRLEAAVWSWKPGQPNNKGGQEDCARQNSEGRWSDVNCSNRYAFACNQVGTNNWVVTGSGAWSEGSSACRSLGSGYQFSVPKNSQSNEALKNANRGSYVWLNYNDLASEGNWVAP